MAYALGWSSGTPVLDILVVSSLRYQIFLEWLIFVPLIRWTLLDYQDPCQEPPVLQNPIWRS